MTASYLLFDAVTGEHKALLDGGELTARRTAAVGSGGGGSAGDRCCAQIAAGRVGAASPPNWPMLTAPCAISVRSKSGRRRRITPKS
ncbi:MAG: hypothetical protein WDN06_16690 [Asticcacaulis sp.]